MRSATNCANDTPASSTASPHTGRSRSRSRQAGPAWCGPFTEDEAMTDLEAIKWRQQEAWADGDFSVLLVAHLIVGELLCEAVDIHPGHTVLDVATCSGNTALAAARRGGQVTGIDFVPALLARGEERAAV